MTTPTEYREFALECLKWADETPNAGQRQTFVDLAAPLDGGCVEVG
jgi:hypothetical protein